MTTSSDSQLSRVGNIFLRPELVTEAASSTYEASTLRHLRSIFKVILKGAVGPRGPGLRERKNSPGGKM